MEIDKVFNNDVDGVADNLFSAVKNSVSEIKAMQQRKAAENVQLVIQALKKIESDLQDKFDGVTTVIEKRVSTIKDGRDGVDGRNGRDGKDGRPGRDGAPGARGPAGVPGTDGRDGEDGVSVTDARIDFDGSLIISLSSGREINVGEVVAPDLAEKIKVITNGGGTSQVVLDTLASLQAQITAISNLGVVNYVGTWNASTNSPTITSGSGDKGDYYVVSVAGSTNIDGQTLWGVGDWIIFNGTAWQRVDGGSTGNFTTVSASGNITTGGDIFTNPDFGIFFNGPSSFSTGIFSSSDGSQMRFYAGGILDALRLTGTGFGVFNNSPAAALDVTGTARISSTVTLSGGTANGVAYLNGSKVLTTGSALTFDGTNLGFGGNLNSTLTSEFYLQSPAGSNFVGINQTSGYVRVAAGNAEVLKLSNTSAIFSLGSAEQMRLTSTGLGIGTSSPGSKLEVTGDITQTWATSMDRFIGSKFSTTYELGLHLLESGRETRIVSKAADSTDKISFYTGVTPTERMRLDSSGNLGIGTSSPGAKLDVAGGALAGGDATYRGDVVIRQVGSSVTSNGGLELKVDNAASGFGARIQSTFNGTSAYDLSFQLRNNSASWTQRMLLDASGNLGLGVTPSAWGSGRAFEIGSGGNGIWSGSGYTSLLQNTAFTSGAYRYVTSQTAARFDIENNTFKWFTAPSGTAGNAISFTQAMTLDASGNLGVGETSLTERITARRDGTTSYCTIQAKNANSTATLNVGVGGSAVGNTALQNNGYVMNAGNSALVFGTNDTERARITSGGEFLVGTANAAGTSGVGVALNPTANGVRAVSAASTNAFETFSMYSTGASAYRFYVDWSGKVNATNTTIAAISDQRLKENVRDLDDGIGAIMALKPRKFDWKAGKGKDIKDDRGFIAQEFEQVFPDMIDNWKDPAPEGEEPYKSVRADLIPVLVKAIQELKAEFDAYKATHP